MICKAITALGVASLTLSGAASAEPEPYSIYYTIPMVAPMYRYSACLLEDQLEPFEASLERCQTIRAELDLLNEDIIPDFHRGQESWRSGQYIQALNGVERNAREIRQTGHAVPVAFVTYLKCASIKVMNDKDFKNSSAVSGNLAYDECRKPLFTAIKSDMTEYKKKAWRLYRRVDFRGRFLTPSGSTSRIQGGWNGHTMSQGLLKIEDLPCVAQVFGSAASVDETICND